MKEDETYNCVMVPSKPFTFPPIDTRHVISKIDEILDLLEAQLKRQAEAEGVRLTAKQFADKFFAERENDTLEDRKRRRRIEMENERLRE